MTTYLLSRENFIKSLRGKGAFEQPTESSKLGENDTVIHDATPESVSSREDKLKESKKKTRKRLKKDYVIFEAF